MMGKKPAGCGRIAEELLAAAMGEAPPGAVERVQRHLETCGPCRREYQAYRAVDGAVAALREARLPEETLARTREQLDTRLADLRRRLLAYRIFPSPLGPILIAQSETGIALVEYLERGAGVRSSRLGREPGVEMVEGGGELETLQRDLLEYLHGRRRHLDWSLDLRLVRSDFHRRVLQATAALPYGAVISYAGIAQEIGRASAVRAVAQALRWNPLPIVIPCHRVIGSSGALTGYAGHKVDLKRRLLAMEGVPTTGHGGGLGIVSEAMYVLVPGDREYCLPTCPSLAGRRSVPLARFASRGHAEAAGLTPCTTCRPDLHPISH